MEITSAIISGVIAGLFSLIAIRYKHSLETKANNSGGYTSTPTMGSNHNTNTAKKESLFLRILKMIGLIILNYYALLAVDEMGPLSDNINIQTVAVIFSIFYLILIIRKGRKISIIRLFFYLFLLTLNLLIGFSG